MVFFCGLGLVVFSMPCWTIYCHTHVESGRRYVGLTKKTMRQRWSAHVYRALRRMDQSYFPNAIRKYGPEAFSHEVLEVCHSLEVANLAEECWIELLDTRNPEKGFNLARGGQHVPHPTRNPWDRPEYRAKSLVSTRKKWEDPELRRKLSSAHLGVKLSQAHCAAISAARKGKDHVPEVRARINESIRARYEDLALRATLSESTKKLWSDEDFRKKTSSSISPAVRAKWQDPEYRAKFARHTETHKLCKVHGPTPLQDCHRRLRGGTVRYECPECNRARNRRAHHDRKLREVESV